MKQKLKTMLALLAALVCGGAWAMSVPYIAFDNSLPTLTGSGASSYVIKQSIEANADGSVTIGEDKGLTLGFVNDKCNTSTFIIKGTGLKRELASGKAVHVLTLPQNNTNQDGGSHNKIGLALNSEGKLQGVWGNQLRTAAPSTQVALTTGDLIAITISNDSNSGGVKAWEYVNHAWVKVFEDTAFNDSSCNYKGFTLGGPYLGTNDYQNKYVASTDISAATGWTISNVAMFNSILTEAQIADYAVWMQKNVYRFAPILTSTYVATGWKVSSIDELLTWNFTGEMIGTSITGSPVAAKGCFPVKHTDGTVETVKVEFQASNGETKAVSAIFKVENGEVWVKGKAACYFNAGNRVGESMFNADGSRRTDITANGTFVTSSTASGYGIQNILATPNYYMSNAASGKGKANYTSRTYTLNLPEATGYASGSKVVVKSIGLATEGSGNDLPAKIEVNGIKSSSRVGPVSDPTIQGVNSVTGYMITYNFTEPLVLTVGTAATSFKFLDASDVTATSQRFALVSRATASGGASTGMKFSALSVSGETSWAPICTVVAEPCPIAPNSDAIFTGTLSHTDWSAIGRVAQGDTIEDVALKYGIAGQLGGSNINSGTPLDATDCYAQVNNDGIMTVEMHVQDGANKKNVLVGFKVESGILKAKWLKGSYKATTVNDRQTTYAENGTTTVNSGFTGWPTYEVKKLVISKSGLLNTTVSKPTVLENNSNLKLHLDASSLSNFTLSNGEVTQWDNLAGSNNAMPAQATAGNATVTRNGYVEVVNGVPAFQMGATGSGIDLGFTRITGIKTVFWVMDIKQEQAAFFLGDVGNNCYDFHRGDNGVYASQDRPFKNASNVRCDNLTVNQASDVAPTGLHVYSAKLATAAAANRLSQDRTINNRNGGRAISELLVFNAELTDEQIESVNLYLLKKWTGYTEKSATVSSDINWSDIEWTGDDDAMALKLTIAENAKLTLDETVTCDTLTISGTGSIAAGEAHFVDGCYSKTLLSASVGIAIADTVTLNQTMKTGFVGALSKTNTTIDLRAQNKEVISINIAGGSISASGTYQPQDTDTNKFVPDTSDLYGLAPVPGSSWNNIGKRWKNYRNTVTLEGAKAWDGATQTTRESMNLSATATTTWEANITNPFLRGYLDDGGGVEVSVTGIPYTTYDVIVYATSDNADWRLAPITVNGTQYTFADGTTKSGSSDWGVALQNVPAFGKNALIIRNQNRQDLSISSAKSSGGRGTLCAVQVINMGGEVLTKRTYETTIETSTTEATLEQLTYTGSGSTLVSGELTQVTLNVSGTASDAELVLTIDPATKTEFLKIVGARPVKIVASGDLTNASLIDLSETSGNVTLAQSAKKVKVGANARLVLADGVTVDTLTNNGGTIRFESDLSAGTVMNFGSGTYEYKNAKITGHNNADYTIHVCNGDILHLEGNNNRTSPNLVIDDEATVTIGSAVATYWYATGNTTYTQTGGTVTVPANGTGTSGSESGLLLGYDGNGITSMTVSGGNLTVASSSLNFYNCPTMTVSGTGHVKAKGVFQGRGSSTVTVSETGIFEIGSLGWSGVALTLNGGALKAFENSTISSAITISSASTIEVPEGVTLTISGAMTGPGSITKTGTGTLKITSDMSGYMGTITASAGCVMASDNTKVTTDGGAVLVEEGRAEYAQGNWTVPSGLEDKPVKVLRPTGAIVDSTVVLADRTVKISGAATNFDLTFNGNINIDYTTVGGSVGKDGTPTYNNSANNTTTGVHLKHRPWVNGAESFFSANHQTFAMAGVMPEKNLKIFMHIGNANGTNHGVYLATGTSDDEVIIGYNEGDTGTTITKMTVPHARTHRHCYIITKDDQTVDGVTTATFTIYLDGLKWKTFVPKTYFRFAGGFQVGSCYGRLVSGYGHADDDNSYVNFFRAYQRIITQAEIDRYTEVYPYESPDGASAREFGAAAANWIEESAVWSNTPNKGETTLGVQPLNNAAVAMTLTEGVATVSANVPAAGVTYSSLNIAGSGSATFKKGENAGAIHVTGMVTIGRPITVEPGSLDLSTAPINILEDGDITFDYSSYDAGAVYETTAIDVTGDIDEQGSGKMHLTAPTAPYRTYALVYNTNLHKYQLVITPNHQKGSKVWVKDGNTYSQFVLEDGTTETGLFPTDKIVISAVGFAANDRWGVDLAKDELEGHLVVIDYPNGGNNPGISVNSDIKDGLNIEIAEGSKMYMQYGYSAFASTISGDGTFSLGTTLYLHKTLTITCDAEMTGSGNFCLESDSVLKVPAESSVKVTAYSGNQGYVKKTTADNVDTYTFVAGTQEIAPSEEPVVVEDIGTGIIVNPGADVVVPTTADTSKIAVKYTLPGTGTVKDLKADGLVTVAVNPTTGAIELTTTDSAKPADTAIAMATPTEGEGEEATDKVQFTITNPIPGLFYAVSSCDTPDGTFESATGDQATSTDAKTVSIPMTFTGDNKVKYYKVSVKATK